MLPVLRLLAIAIFTIVCAGLGGGSVGSLSSTEAHRAFSIVLGATVAPKTTHQLRDHDGRHRPLDVAEADLDDDDTDDDTDESRSDDDDAHHHLVAVDDIRLLHAPCCRERAGAVDDLDTSRFVTEPGLPRGPPATLA